MNLFYSLFLTAVFFIEHKVIAAIMKMNGMKGALKRVSPWMASTSESEPPIIIIKGKKACLYARFLSSR